MDAAHVPVRTCAGCRQRGAKSGMLRLVRGPEDAVRVDPTGSAPGRGAYVHLREACVDGALRKGGLVRALRTGLGPEELGRLASDIEQRMGAS